MAKQQIVVPDIGGAEDAEVVELLVAVGDQVEEEQSLLVLESDKASMEIPSSASGIVLELLVKEGDQLSEGAAILVLETSDGAVAKEPVGQSATEAIPAEAPPAPDPEAEAPDSVPDSSPVEASVDTAGAQTLTVVVPDIGTDEAVDLIEISLQVGDTVEEGDSLVALELALGDGVRLSGEPRGQNGDAWGARGEHVLLPGAIPSFPIVHEAA